MPEKMPDFKVTVVAEFRTKASDPFDAAIQIVSDLVHSGRVPVTLKTEVAEDA